MEKRLYLSDTNKKIAGVCGGLSEYLNIDATILRLIAVVLIFIHGVGILGYLAAWIIMPRRAFNSMENR